MSELLHTRWRNGHIRWLVGSVARPTAVIESAATRASVIRIDRLLVQRALLLRL